MRAFSIFAMVLALLWAGPVAADDVTLELGAEDDFVVHDASGNAARERVTAGERRTRRVNGLPLRCRQEGPEPR